MKTNSILMLFIFLFVAPIEIVAKPPPKAVQAAKIFIANNWKCFKKGTGPGCTTAKKYGLQAAVAILSAAGIGLSGYGLYKFKNKTEMPINISEPKKGTTVLKVAEINVSSDVGGEEKDLIMQVLSLLYTGNKVGLAGLVKSKLEGKDWDQKWGKLQSLFLRPQPLAALSLVLSKGNLSSEFGNPNSGKLYSSSLNDYSYKNPEEYLKKLGHELKNL